LIRKDEVSYGRVMIGPMVATVWWEKVHNLKLLGYALRIRWLWTQKTNPDRPWAGLHVHVPAMAKALFDVVVDAIVGNGEEILFWKDRWLDGHTLAELAPCLFKTIAKRIVNRRTVAQALDNRNWVHDIKGALTVQVLVEYLHISNMVEDVILCQDVADQYNGS
jgi:hypothetical protein